MRLGQVIAVSAGLLLAAAGVDQRLHAQAAANASPQKLTFQGDVALWTVAIKPDKTSKFEQIMTRVREALAKSPDTARQRQAAGWKVMRIEKPLPDGNIAYIHVISPVIQHRIHCIDSNPGGGNACPVGSP